MAQQQQNISMNSPGFYGLNLEDSPVDLPTEYATTANNAVIDSLGRLAARKGFKDITPAGLAAADYDIQSIGRIVDVNIERFIAGVDVDGTPELWEISGLNTDSPSKTTLTLPGGYTMATANVQIIDFAGRGVVIVPGSEMLVISNGLVAKASDQASWIPPTALGGTPIHTTFSPNCGVAAFGRLWVSGVDGDEETVYYSDILNPGKWLDLQVAPTDPLNTGGGLNVSENWPLGKDRIVGLAAHNNNFVVFGRSSILVWGNPQGDPADVGGIFLSDTIENIGLVNRDAVTSDGRDLLFMDDTGLRSLGRTIQEQSAAIGDLTRPVRTAITSDLRKTLLSGGVELSFSPKNSFVLIIMRTIGVVWVCDTRTQMQDGSYRITKWPSTELNTALYIEAYERLILGTSNNTTPLARYSDDNVDYSGDYVFEYSSPLLSFGDSSRLKIVKQVDYQVLTGGSADVDALAKLDYFGQRNRELTKRFTLVSSEGTVEYAAQEYSDGSEYGLGETILKTYRYNAGSSGERVKISFNVPINGNSCSLSGINIQTKLGRVI